MPSMALYGEFLQKICSFQPCFKCLFRTKLLIYDPSHTYFLMF